MDIKVFKRIANWGVTGYLTRHGLEPTDLKITSARREKTILFRFYHRGECVHRCYGRKAMLDWMRESQPVVQHKLPLECGKEVSA